MLNFRKMHGLGNDFVILDRRNDSFDLSAEQITKICDRHFGVGCDLLAVLEDSEAADIRALFFNADGSSSSACGNATRCIADIILNETGKDRCTIETGRGALKAWRADDNMVTVDMGAPKLGWQDIPLAEERDTLMLTLSEQSSSPAVAVNMGNPHCVLFVDDVNAAPVELLGQKIEHMPLFPERTNVEFVQVLEDGRLRQRTWERGVGETLACGSGACAVGVAAMRRDLVDASKVEIILNGGSLFIEWAGEGQPVLMTGPYTYVFEGQIDV